MSQTLTAGPLGEVTRAVLGNAAFLFCDEVPAGAAAHTGRLAEASITFDAPRPGRLTLRVPWSVAVEAAANLLGAERDDPEVEESALAAVGELLNMISGSALAQWFGAGARWSLDIPSTRARDGQLPSPAPEGEVIGFLVDDARIEIEAIATEGRDDQGPRR